jgi:hypothetical protein
VGEVSTAMSVGCFHQLLHPSHVSLGLASHHYSDIEGDSFSSDFCTSCLFVGSLFLSHLLSLLFFLLENSANNNESFCFVITHDNPELCAMARHHVM